MTPWPLITRFTNDSSIPLVFLPNVGARFTSNLKSAFIINPGLKSCLLPNCKQGNLLPPCQRCLFIPLKDEKAEKADS